MTDTYLYIPKLVQKEGSSFTATAYFRTAKASATPTTAHYRVDCLTTGKNLTDWTSLAVATSIDISIPATDNAIQHAENQREKKQITVAADKGTSTETRDTKTYFVKNIRGF